MISADQQRKHLEAMSLVNSDKELNDDEKQFIIENFIAASSNEHKLTGAFFTPIDYAFEVAGMEVPENCTVLDLCAGIGSLAYAISKSCNPSKLVCVELNPAYVEVGKRIVPEATWIVADALTVELQERFNVVVSNPPFGNIKTSTAEKGKYKGSKFEFRLIEKAASLASYGIFILPQASAPFSCSGLAQQIETPEATDAFSQQTGIVLEQGASSDSSVYLDQWQGAKPLCEVVVANFKPQTKQTPCKPENLDLFAVA